MRKFLATLAFALAFSANAQAQNNNLNQAAGPGPSTTMAPPAPVTVATWRSTVPFIAAETDPHARCTTMRGWYEFALNGNHLVVTNSSGARTETEVGPDGSVYHAFHTRLGSHMVLSGNAYTKQLKLSPVGYACVMDASPNG